MPDYKAIPGPGYAEWKAKGQTAAEILEAAKNINNPDNVVGLGLVEVTIDGKTLVGTRDKLVDYFKEYIGA